jgi:CRISPR/Cas system CMR-associated protein Cmr5 small subunit
VRNKLRRLAEFIQEGYPEKFVEVFKYSKNQSLEERLTLASKAIAFHQAFAEALWLQAGKKRTAEERRAAAQAELASFVFACLTGEAKEHAGSTIEAMRALGRQGEIDIILSLTKR